jgi:hypothetical protein
MGPAARDHFDQSYMDLEAPALFLRDGRGGVVGKVSEVKMLPSGTVFVHFTLLGKVASVNGELPDYAIADFQQSQA